MHTGSELRKVLGPRHTFYSGGIWKYKGAWNFGSRLLLSGPSGPIGLGTQTVVIFSVRVVKLSCLYVD